ncbi:Non-heme bromoperoxidase BPO-A2 [bacterium HR29]|jgi:3-oxoadipate enol-lactonase|nr:Non-heme bromoperoxidase BPO-A2 [bacterium HR29]
MPFARNGETNIWYEVFGEGTPVILLMGVGGSRRAWWERFPELLARRHQVVLIDNRGTGKSSKPARPWTMADMAADVHAVVRDLALGSFHLAGCSLGSIIARHYVANWGGERLRSLALLCPPNGVPASEEDRNAALFWDRSRPLIESARKSWPVIHPADWVAANEELLVRKFEESLREPTPARTFRFQLDAAQAAGFANEAVNRYAWPVLVLHGTADRLVPPANAIEVAKAIPRAQVVWLEGASHNFWCHAPDESASVLNDFFARADAAAGVRYR